ncbi:MAG: hypothetical protein ISR76_03450, partial [Planctomycetes bacterium]|nr:hypothetical protein [Planctomycetota bacterium]
GAAAPSFASFALAEELADFDPLEAWSTSHQVLQRQVYEGLVEYRYHGRTDEFVGLLAERWEVSEDGLEWRFRLRPDLSFYDPHEPPLWPGRRRPVVARDVVDSFLRLADPRLGAQGWFALEGLLEGLDEFRERAAKGAEEAEAALAAARDGAGLPGLRAPDEATVVLRLRRPAPDLLMRLASPYCVVTPREAFAHPDRGLRDHPVGSGPYSLAEWLPRSRAVFRRVPGWRTVEDEHGPLPHIDELRFQAVLEGSTRALLFEQGQIDRLPPVQDSFARMVDGDRPSAELRARGVRLAVTETPDLSMLVLNLDDPVIGDLPGDDAGNQRRRLLRRAIALSFPYERWHRDIRERTWGSPATRYLPPSVAESAGLPESAWRRHDPELARRLLAEAGWPGGDGLPELQLELSGTDQGTADLRDMVVEGLKQIGVRCRATANSPAEYSAKTRGGRAQLFFWSWALDWPDAANLLEVFYSGNAGGGINRANLRSPAFDALFEEFRGLGPGPRRMELAREMVLVLDQELPVVPVDHRRGFLLLQPWLKNVEVNPFDLFPCKYFVVESRG